MLDGDKIGGLAPYHQSPVEPGQRGFKSMRLDSDIRFQRAPAGPRARSASQIPFSDAVKDKPSIVEVIGDRVDLRKSGRNYRGRCPFHQDKTPSLSVSEEKGLFHCFGCGESGDVIDFIQKLDGLSFPEACRVLGIDIACKFKSRPALTEERIRAAELGFTWVREQRAKLYAMIADASYMRDLADEAGAFDLADTLEREWFFLREFDDTLNYGRGAAEMLAVREGIESITAGAETSL